MPLTNDDLLNIQALEQALAGKGDLANSNLSLKEIQVYLGEIYKYTDTRKNEWDESYAQAENGNKPEFKYMSSLKNYESTFENMLAKKSKASKVHFDKVLAATRDQKNIDEIKKIRDEEIPRLEYMKNHAGRDTYQIYEKSYNETVAEKDLEKQYEKYKVRGQHQELEITSNKYDESLTKNEKLYILEGRYFELIDHVCHEVEKTLDKEILSEAKKKAGQVLKLTRETDDKVREIIKNSPEYKDAPKDQAPAIYARMKDELIKKEEKEPEFIAKMNEIEKKWTDKVNILVLNANTQAKTMLKEVVDTSIARLVTNRNADVEAFQQEVKKYKDAIVAGKPVQVQQPKEPVKQKSGLKLKSARALKHELEKKQKEQQKLLEQEKNPNLIIPEESKNEINNNIIQEEPKKEVNANVISEEPKKEVNNNINPKEPEKEDYSKLFWRRPKGLVEPWERELANKDEATRKLESQQAKILEDNVIRNRKLKFINTRKISDLKDYKIKLKRTYSYEIKAKNYNFTTNKSFINKDNSNVHIANMKGYRKLWNMELAFCTDTFYDDRQEFRVGKNDHILKIRAIHNILKKNTKWGFTKNSEEYTNVVKKLDEFENKYQKNGWEKFLNKDKQDEKNLTPDELRERYEMLIELNRVYELGRDYMVAKGPKEKSWSHGEKRYELMYLLCNEIYEFGGHAAECESRISVIKKDIQEKKTSPSVYLQQIPDQATAGERLSEKYKNTLSREMRRIKQRDNVISDDKPLNNENNLIKPQDNSIMNRNM